MKTGAMLFVSRYQPRQGRHHEVACMTARLCKAVRRQGCGYSSNTPPSPRTGMSFENNDFTFGIAAANAGSSPMFFSTDSMIIAIGNVGPSGCSHGPVCPRTLGQGWE